MIPLSDDNPRHEGEHAWFTWGIIGLCIAVFLYQLGLPPETGQFAAFMYGAIPGEITGHLGPMPPELVKELNGATVPEPAIAPWLTLFTSMFMHGGFMHIIGNMLYLWIFGDNVEVAMGHKRFVVFYLLCGVIAALTHTMADPSSPIPMVGASGAISGVLGAYVLLYPRATVKVLMFLGIFTRIIHVPAWIVLGLWFVMQLFGTLGGAGAGVAFWAHIGGFVAGLVLVKLFLKPEEHLVHSRQTTPWQMQKPPPPKWRGPWDRN